MFFFKKVNEASKLPQSINLSPTYDVFSDEEITIRPGETRKIKLGFKINIKDENKRELKDFFIGLYLRESIGSRGLILVNGVGVISLFSDEEISIRVFNTLEDPQSYENRIVKIKKGEAIAQIAIHKHYGFELLHAGYRYEK